MSEDPRDPLAGLAEGMEAAGALIESLEGEVESLRTDLEEAYAALKAAQEEVSSRADELQEKERDRIEATRKAEGLQEVISSLKRRHSDEQLRLSNELAQVRRRLEEQRVAEVDAASNGSRVEDIKEEVRHDREALEARYRSEVEALKNASEHWEEQLRTSYQEQEARHMEQMESAHQQHAEREGELEQSLTETFERRLAEQRSNAEDRHTAAVQTLRNAAAERELELQNHYEPLIERQQRELEELRGELESSGQVLEEKHKREVRELKALMEHRESELKRTQAARVAEARESAEKRISALQAQREADNRALRTRHAEETERLRREGAERLAAEESRRKSETWALEERLGEVTLQRETEHRAYTARLEELEAARLAQRSASTEDVEQAVGRFGVEVSAYESRIVNLEGDLRESEKRRSDLESLLEDLRHDSRGHNGARPEGAYEADDGQERDLEDVEVQQILAEDRVKDLEAKLEAAREEGRRNAEALAEALESLERLSNPARRLREGIALFNASDHANTVASISRSFGLPMVHAALDDETPAKPTLTFIWGEVAWRRYVSDPTDGVEEPRVYLIGAGEDPTEIDPPVTRHPNARMNSRGHLTMGVQAR
jgi:DNA repair exonuclease SbcCD ATPase subunit